MTPKSAPIDATKMPKLPRFKSLDEAAEFWDTHSFVDYIEQTEPVEIRVNLPAEGLDHIAIEANLLAQIRDLAAKRGVQPEELIESWLEEKLATTGSDS